MACPKHCSPGMHLSIESLQADSLRTDALRVERAMQHVSTHCTAVYDKISWALNLAMLDPTVQEAYREVWGVDWTPNPPVATLADAQRDALRTVLLRDLPWAGSDVELVEDEDTLAIEEWGPVGSGAAVVRAIEDGTHRATDYCDYGAML